MATPEEKLPGKSKDPIMALLAQYKVAIQSVLPKHLTPERILRIAYTAIKKTPKLRECSQASIINAVLEASMRGLEIGYGAHLVPYKDECVLICDYKGYIDLAHRSGQIDSFPLKPVYERDEFDYEEGTTRYIKHKPYRGTDGRGELVAAYAIVFFKHGGFDFEVVLPADAAAAKKMSPGAKFGDSPWNKPDLEYTMWCKTAARKISKRVPQSPELQRVAQLEELAEAGLRQQIAHVDAPIDVTFADVDKKTEQKVTDLKKRLQDKGATKIDKPPIQEEEKEQGVQKGCPECGSLSGGHKEGCKFIESLNTGPWHRPNWINLRSAGFPSHVWNYIDTLKEQPKEIIDEVRQKWIQGCKLAEPFPLDIPPTKEQEDPEPELSETTVTDDGMANNTESQKTAIIDEIIEHWRGGLNNDDVKEAMRKMSFAIGRWPLTLNGCQALYKRLQENEKM